MIKSKKWTINILNVYDNAIIKYRKEMLMEQIKTKEELDALTNENQNVVIDFFAL